MTRLSLLAALFISLLGCNHNISDKRIVFESKKQIDTIYSKNISDSFYISVSLPKEYAIRSNLKYPVVYILDANLYFDIFSAIVNKYSELGLMFHSILIGVGYKDLKTMDSLRNRDYTYPQALAEYEMTVSGNANRFLRFLNDELIPFVDTKYNIDTARRALMGHSLGGYF